MSDSKYKINFTVDGSIYKIFDVVSASVDLGLEIKKLPYSLRVLFENVLRFSNSRESLVCFKDWIQNKTSNQEIPFYPARVICQDFSGVPAVVDLASMRDAVKSRGVDPTKINPLIPVDFIIDHSVQVDYYGSHDAFSKNVHLEMQRNMERYEFLKWGQQAFKNFRVVPPGTGICHQVNLEYLSQVVWRCSVNDEVILYPDTLVGTDSHTTMVNALAVLGWGVGGIEAEAAMLGQPLPMIMPDVVGVHLTGELDKTATATDLVLTITQLLRKKGVVGKFVEFFGNGINNLSLADRATVANMAPEYGATCGYFPIDSETIKYLYLTSKSEENIKLIEAYAKKQCLWYDADFHPEYTDVLHVDLSSIQTSLAGPKRPQDRVILSLVPENFQTELPSLAKGDQDINKHYEVPNHNYSLAHGSLAIAAITSCTNTSNPYVMVAAGLLAKKAVEFGLKQKEWVKTSLAPGSKVVTEYLNASGLQLYLDKLGFNLVGYGCTTCIGNSGPLDNNIQQTILDNQLVVAAVLSGNRNFEGRVHSLVRANYLASPPLVVAYALAGKININLATEPLGKSAAGVDVYLKDLWPTREEIELVITKYIDTKMFSQKYSDVFEGDENWRAIKVPEGNTYQWHKESTYIQSPPYFSDPSISCGTNNIKSAKILAIFGDSITTDHISPAGNISFDSPAGKYLLANGVQQADFNSYGARRGNHEVMMRGTFANNRIRNEMCPGVEGGWTIHQIEKKQMRIYDAAMDYHKKGHSLVIFAGKEYGSGSSRDWAAKGTRLLGVQAIIAESFERIHRSNLVGMGVLPLVFTDGMTRRDLDLDGSEEVDIIGLDNNIKQYQLVDCIIKKQNGQHRTIKLMLQIFTDNEINYINDGGIMHNVVNSYVDSKNTKY